MDNLYKIIRQKLIDLLKNDNYNSTMAIDGWTNVRHNKVTNVMLIVPLLSQAFYWKTIENESDFNTAEWNTEKLIPIIEEFLKMGFKLSGIVLDNENLCKSIVNNL